jgi:hypothetical protein
MKKAFISNLETSYALDKPIKLKKLTKGNKLKIMKCRVQVLVHCTVLLNEIYHPVKF